MNGCRLQSFLSCWIFNPIKSKVVTMETMKKCVKIGGKNHCDMERLYCRLLVVSQNRNVSLQSTICYELAPYHLQYWMTMAKRGNKVLLIHKVAVWYDGPHKIEASVEGGSEALYQIVWPNLGPLHGLFQNFLRAVTKPHLVVVVFELYLEGSIKHNSVFEEQKAHIALIIILLFGPISQHVTLSWRTHTTIASSSEFSVEMLMLGTWSYMVRKTAYFTRKRLIVTLSLCQTVLQPAQKPSWSCIWWCWYLCTAISFRLEMAMWRSDLHG